MARQVPKRTKRSKVTASISTKRRGGRSVSKPVPELEELVPPGPASVSTTFGNKKWGSDSVSGITADCSVTVTLSCQQDELSINHAYTQASRYAETFMNEGGVVQESALREFMEKDS